MLHHVQYIALFVLAVEATAWSHADIDLRHEFGHVLVPRQTTNLQVCISTIVDILEEGIADRTEKVVGPTIQWKLICRYRPSPAHWEALPPSP
jgi:hypothetical protein